MTKETLNLCLSLVSQVRVSPCDQNADQVYATLRQAKNELSIALGIENEVDPNT